MTKKFRCRIPAISQLWIITEAETKEEAFENVVSDYEAQSPKIRWRDWNVWEIEEVPASQPVHWIGDKKGG